MPIVKELKITAGRPWAVRGWELLHPAADGRWSLYISIRDSMLVNAYVTKREISDTLQATAECLALSGWDEPALTLLNIVRHWGDHSHRKPPDDLPEGLRAALVGFVDMKEFDVAQFSRMIGGAVPPPQFRQNRLGTGPDEQISRAAEDARTEAARSASLDLARVRAKPPRVRTAPVPIPLNGTQVTTRQPILASPEVSTVRAAPAASSWLSRRPDLAFRGDENLRICNLAFEPPDDALDLTDELRVPGGKIRLLNIQSQMLDAARNCNGLLAFAGTGSGKTYAALLFGSVMENVDRVLIFAPASTLKNLQTERIRVSNHFRLHGDIRIHSYEALQRPTPEGDGDYIETEILRDGNNPNRTLLVFDEAHAIKNLTSARGLRSMRAILKYPGIRVCAMSGSMTDKSIRDYLHLSWMALRDKSPVPSPWLWPLPADFKPHAPKTAAVIWHNNAADAAMAWSAVIDKDGEANGTDWEDFLPLWQWAFGYESAHPLTFATNTERRALAQRALAYRLRTAPGVVVSRATSLEDTALILHGVDDFEVPDEIEQAITRARDEGVDPDGNVLPDFSSVWRTVRQLAQGFYYVWDWPLDPLTKKPLRDGTWLKARADWNRMVRREILDGAATGYDSALLVYMTVLRQIRRLHATTPLHEAWLSLVARAQKNDNLGNVSVREHGALQAWFAAGGSDEAFDQCELHFSLACRRNALEAAWVAWSARFKHQQRPPTKAVWLNMFVLDRAVRWVGDRAAEGFKPLIWYDHQAVGEALAQRGIRTYGAGTNPNPDNFIEPSFAFTCALSIRTHSEGKNLQPWSRNLVLCPPVSGTRWEQLLARTHRTGQTAPSVHCWVMQHVVDFREAVGAARAAADYVQTTTDNEQKLLRAMLENIRMPRLGTEEIQRLEECEAVEQDAE